MERVTGIGGIFFKAKDPGALREWYATHLGVEIDASFGGSVFTWREPGCTVWSPFPEDTSYFDPGRATFMVNYRVANLDAMLEQLRKAGARVDEKTEDGELGRFGWAMDPEGNRFELWQPPPGR